MIKSAWLIWRFQLTSNKLLLSIWSVSCDFEFDLRHHFHYITGDFYGLSLPPPLIQWGCEKSLLTKKEHFQE